MLGKTLETGDFTADVTHRRRARVSADGRLLVLPAPKLDRSGILEKTGDARPSGLEFRLHPGLDCVLLMPEGE